jgi:hypothetical protein
LESYIKCQQANKQKSKAKTPHIAVVSWQKSEILRRYRGEISKIRDNITAEFANIVNLCSVTTLQAQ